MAAFAIPETAEQFLVVDDDQDMCWVLKAALAGLGGAVTAVGSASAAIASLADHDFAVAFVDARLPDIDGLKLVEELRRLRPAMRVIMISGYYLEDDVRLQEAVRASEIDGFLAKPFRIDAIITAVKGKSNGNCHP